MSRPGSTKRYFELAAKVDGFFEATRARVGSAMQCVPGCADCCQPGLTVTAVEAAAIEGGLATLSESARGDLAARAEAGDAGACAALSDRGTCDIYAWRPLVCRSHGVPVKVAPAAPGHLPVVQVCPKNFTDGLDDVGSDLMLDQRTLSTVLGAIDAAYSDEAQVERGTRTSIAALLLRAPRGTIHE